MMAMMAMMAMMIRSIIQVSSFILTLIIMWFYEDPRVSHY